jgi:hypothetical protein
MTEPDTTDPGRPAKRGEQAGVIRITDGGLTQGGVPVSHGIVCDCGKHVLRENGKWYEDRHTGGFVTMWEGRVVPEILSVQVPEPECAKSVVWRWPTQALPETPPTR